MKYRKKPVVIEAIRWNGPEDDALLSAFADHWVSIVDTGKSTRAHRVEITTQEGVMTVSPGDYVIKGVKGEFYPCKPDIFEATYDAVSDKD